MDSLEHLHAEMESTWSTVIAAAEMGGASPAQKDAIVTTGERISNHVMSRVLRGQGVPSQFHPANTLVVTDGTHGDAQPDLEASAPLVQGKLLPQLKAGVVPCVTGFYGAHPALPEAVCTFGRGGSDLTASTLAHCLASEPGKAAVVVWKVECTTAPDGTMAEWEDGFTGVVHDADVGTTIPHLSYAEAHELVQFGKKVLHPATMRPAAAKEVPVFVKNTFRPHLAGTRIGGGEAGPARAASVTSAPLPKAMNMTKGRMQLDEGAMVSELGVGGAADTSLMVVVGHGVDAAATREEAVGALAAQGISAYLPPVVTDSPHTVCVAVPEAQRKAAAQILHRELVQGGGARAEA